MSHATSQLRAASLLLVMSVLLLSGCASQREIVTDQPLSETQLFMTRAGEEVNLSWDSDPAMNYTIVYNTSLSGAKPWQVLPGHDYIRGTGRTITYRDRVPVGVNRYYRLQIVPAMGR